MLHFYSILFILVQLLVLQLSTYEISKLGDNLDLSYYNISALKQIGCSRTRRLLLLKANQSFQNPPSNFLSIPSSQLSTASDSHHWLPKCRLDRPDLYEARQCSERDCFCVNVTTGQAFVGTWTNPEDSENCTTALFRIVLYVSQNEPFSVEDVATNDEKLSPNPDASYWEPKIVKEIGKLCFSTVGYQRVSYIKRTPVSSIYDFPPLGRSSLTEDPSRLLMFELELLSSGSSGAIRTTQELIQHRLDEGYLPGIGPVESGLSFIELLEPSLPDPAPVLLKELAVGTFQNYKENGPRLFKVFNEVEGAPDGGISGFVVSHDDQIESLSGPMQLDGDSMEAVDTGEREVFRPISARQTAGDLTTQNMWRRKSISELLSQPGVIAGIVGSTLAGVLLLILLILFCIYRLRKKDEGSYSLDESKKTTSLSNPYVRAPSREFYA